MDILKYNYRGNTTVGFHATITNKKILAAPEFKRKKQFEDENIVETFIAKTRLVGLFTAGNKNQILVPDNITRVERQKLEENNVDYTVIESKDNALGNLILCNDKGALISPKIEEHKEKIENALEVPVETGKVAGIENPGVCGVANNHGALLHRAADEEEAEKVKNILKVDKVDIGTVNMGSPFIGSGALTNDQVIIVGEDCTGPEIGRIDQTLVPKE